jgi:hypothetical protein
MQKSKTQATLLCIDVLFVSLGRPSGAKPANQNVREQLLEG